MFNLVVYSHHNVRYITSQKHEKKTHSSDGKIDYSNIIKFIEDNQAENVKKDNRYVIGYTFYGSTWIAYENEATIPEKIALAKAHNVHGYFAWNIAADDDVNTLANAAKSNW